jgi:hypothetical protein
MPHTVAGKNKNWSYNSIEQQLEQIRGGQYMKGNILIDSNL